MMKTIQSVMQSMARSPLKAILTLATVGIGVGVLIFALSISSSFRHLITQQLDQDGSIITFANGQYNDSGVIEPARPPQFDQNMLNVVRTEVSGVKGISPLQNAGTQWMAGGNEYRFRTVMAVNEQYPQIVGLSLVAGSFFNAQDVNNGAKKAVISKSLAEIVFGSVDAALGKTLQRPVPSFVTSSSSSSGTSSSSSSTSSSSSSGSSSSSSTTSNNNGRQRTFRFFAPVYTVVGVYKDVTELQRKAYGVGDMIIPYTSMLPPDVNQELARRFFNTTAVVKVTGISTQTAEAQIRDVLTRQYGSDLELEVWEGTPQGATDFITQIRQTINTFSLVVNILGFILLAAASIGILSIMLVEALGRSREIAVERALGASKRMIIKEFFVRSAVVSIISAVIGIILSLAFAGPLTQLVLPIFATVTAADLGGSVINISSLLIGVISAIVIGGIFGVFPVFSVLQAGIADSIREA